MATYNTLYEEEHFRSFYPVPWRGTFGYAKTTTMYLQTALSPRDHHQPRAVSDGQIRFFFAESASCDRSMSYNCVGRIPAENLHPTPKLARSSKARAT